jgi:NAD(P)-dependent dehydrogenase (short-subunit alcohol dehydrogenase family)
VTGGGSGIGLATAALLADEGAIVFVADINETAAQAVVAEHEKTPATGSTQVFWAFPHPWDVFLRAFVLSCVPGWLLCKAERAKCPHEKKQETKP